MESDIGKGTGNSEGTAVLSEKGIAGMEPRQLPAAVDVSEVQDDNMVDSVKEKSVVGSEGHAQCSTKGEAGEGSDVGAAAKEHEVPEGHSANGSEAVVQAIVLATLPAVVETSALHAEVECNATMSSDEAPDGLVSEEVPANKDIGDGQDEKVQNASPADEKWSLTAPRRRHHCLFLLLQQKNTLPSRISLCRTSS